MSIKKVETLYKPPKQLLETAESFLEHVKNGTIRTFIAVAPTLDERLIFVHVTEPEDGLKLLGMLELGKDCLVEMFDA